jgi:hypothetical protein
MNTLLATSNNTVCSEMGRDWSSVIMAKIPIKKA